MRTDTGEWSFETDVLVVGAGGCGLSAGIAAAQSGAQVLILEKQDKPWSNTARSGGMIPAAGTRFQRAAGIHEGPEDLAQDILKKNQHTSDPATTRYLAGIAPLMVEWLVDEVGVDLVFIDDFKYPGHSQFRMHAPPSRTGEALVADLRRAVEKHPEAELVNDAPVSDLILNDQLELVGVLVQRGLAEERVRCKKLILACNGFAGNPDMVRQYCPAMVDALYYGGEGNTGEGILWGMELGGTVAFMDAFQAHASVASPHGILITYALIMEGGFQVNERGRRFGNESRGYSEHALDVLGQPGGLAWDIYDKRLHRLALNFEDYRQAVEVGAILSDETLTGLARKLGLPAETLNDTVEAYHEAATGNRTDPFGREDCRRLEPPFYGVKVTGALFHTQGGLVVDTHARVLRPDGTPIPHLYAGGGVAAGVSGHGAAGYFSGNGLLTALGYGLLAGKHAAHSILEGV